MAHYAFLDENNTVVEVITGRNENEVVDGISDWETYYGNFRGLTCKRTSYNTRGGVNVAGGIAFRKNFAGIGMRYSPEMDAFISEKPFESWVLNEETCLWEPPTPCPEEEGKIFIWDEPTVSWVDVTP